MRFSLSQWSLKSYSDNEATVSASKRRDWGWKGCPVAEQQLSHCRPLSCPYLGERGKCHAGLLVEPLLRASLMCIVILFFSWSPVPVFVLHQCQVVTTHPFEEHCHKLWSDGICRPQIFWYLESLFKTKKGSLFPLSIQA